eukprot:CAMPEP_0170469608 /NCGR_PEP_ID=MMETSP0123-20130129/12381_1 /TAXON_ID=182087 /ORGANISM="Favella ehrenbergii, Strain Fehren 1" /LENGTH=115 /DNA_ID=CAMNT_0010736533 /DNA_START=495 /DNA_END=842 /DNA_ORIENTATION=+
MRPPHRLREVRVVKDGVHTQELEKLTASEEFKRHQLSNKKSKKHKVSQSFLNIQPRDIYDEDVLANVNLDAQSHVVRSRQIKDDASVGGGAPVDEQKVAEQTVFFGSDKTSDNED